MQLAGLLAWKFEHLPVLQQWFFAQSWSKMSNTILHLTFHLSRSLQLRG